MRLSKIALAVAALVGAITPASAAKYALHYTAVHGTILPTTADFRITTADVVNAIGGFDILSVSGFVNGVAITGLAPVNPPGFRTNNVFYAGTPAFDELGLGWTSGTTTGNLWFAANRYVLAQYDPAQRRYPNQTDGTLSVAAVPEPASWGMMIIGFAAVGVMRRRGSPLAA